ncbi:PREDICTED: protein FAM81B isoform X3 [Condylura cristata]|uniref:protein FAM81B isoform X3 n=1 Tax=Condylura cristata TaxID=143302 RepID=UPI000643B6A3|nr:PREDICTED: protein FAM81B isoform X3 [Condylura cristata]
MVMDHRGQTFLPVIPNTQRSQLEDRLNNQERTIAFLLEQAFRIKEDISACLQGAHGFRKEESLARKLLESHIQTITSIVKKLSQNIEILEDQIRVRDQVATGTNYAVQELNTKHSQGVGDLRGRVARCDSSIVKLSGDIYFIRHEHRRVEKTIQELLSALETVSKNLDMKVTQLLGKIEASSSEQASNIKMVQGDYRHEINLLEFKGCPVTWLVAPSHPQSQQVSCQYSPLLGLRALTPLTAIVLPAISRNSKKMDCEVLGSKSQKSTS